jgi:hypothetical protein
MTRLQIFVMAGVLGAGLLALGTYLSARSEEPPTAAELLIRKWRHFVDEVCRCKDARCVGAATELVTSYAKLPPVDPPRSPEQAKELEALYARAAECMSRVVARPRALNHAN